MIEIIFIRQPNKEYTIDNNLIIFNTLFKNVRIYLTFDRKNIYIFKNKDKDVFGLKITLFLKEYKYFFFYF